MPILTPEEFADRYPVQGVNAGLLRDTLLYAEQQVRRSITAGVYEQVAGSPDSDQARLVALAEGQYAWAWLLGNRSLALLSTGAAIRLRLPDGVEVQNATPEQIAAAVATLERAAAAAVSSLVAGDETIHLPDIDVAVIDPFGDLACTDRQIDERNVL
jgi:hypothetical protein